MLKVFEMKCIELFAKLKNSRRGKIESIYKQKKKLPVFRFFFQRVENIVREGKILVYQHFLTLPLCFQKTCS